MLSSRAVGLRVFHGLLCLYFSFCLIYMYYAAVVRHFDLLLAVCITSLALEGTAVYILNKGDCPLIHIQRRVGDERPFFELFFPPKLAKLAIPIFSAIVLIGLVFLIIR